MRDPISQFVYGTKDTAFGKACANGYDLETTGARAFYETIFKPFFKKVLPVTLAIYLAATGLAKGREWLSQNTELGKRLDRLESKVDNSDFSKGLSEAGSAIGSMR